MAKSIYVLDTCVLLHDPNALFRFAEHDLYLPLAVIDDLDEIKTRPASVGWSARETFRILEPFVEGMKTKSGAKINSQGGRLFILNTDAPLAQGETPNIVRKYSDNEIITAASMLQAKYPNRKVIIVTKDLGLRIRAESFGCRAENYRSDLLEDENYTGMRLVAVEDAADWNLLWSSETVAVASLSAALQARLAAIAPNEFLIIEWGESRCPTLHQNGQLKVLKDRGGKISFMDIEPRNLEQRCALEALADETIPLVSLLGPAGTGKTLLTLAVALDKITDDRYDRIVIIKPLIPVGGKDIGALPGDKFEKIVAWLGPMRDNIEQILGGKANKKSAAGRSKSHIDPLEDFEGLVERGIVEVEAMAFIQGRSIPRAFIIIDEAQNLSPREARMVVERCGEGSKVVLLGDLSQVENPYLDRRSSGLAHAVNGGKKSQQAAVVTLCKVERSALAAVASEIFGQPEAQR